MTTPMCEDGGPLREWAPLTTLLQQIPAKIQNGIFTHDISFTCIDAVAEFIAIGTNHGLIYWFNRKRQDLQRLRCENINAKITCVQVISTVDYMVAAGNERGVVTVFQIPKNPPDSLPDSLKPKQKKQVERYSISGLHKTVVTTVEWSKNGMKLFSGDQDGLVVLTEIDFYMHLSKSSELLNEKYSIVQLSYQQGLLLVSTTLRTIVVNRNEKGKVTQVGQKERKTLGKLGAVFGCRQNHVQELVIYASRPGLRLWQADKTGTVLKTLMFKDAIRSAPTEVELLNPAPDCSKRSRSESAFGIVLPFCDDLLVTYGDDIIYVVNPETIAITSIVTDLRHITDISCTKDEIFILEGGRNIIRLAHYPETNGFATEAKSTLDSLASFVEISKPVTTGILELTSKLKESTIGPVIPFRKINSTDIMPPAGVIPITADGTDVHTVINGEEAVEEPPLVPMHLNAEFTRNINKLTEYDISKKQNFEQDDKRTDRNQIFQIISQQEFEDVVFTPEKKAKKLRVLTDENEYKMLATDSMVVSNEDEVDSSEPGAMQSSFLTLSIDDDFVAKSKPNLETIQQDVENKEKLLADVLDFDLSKYMSNNQVSLKRPSVPNSATSIAYTCNTHSKVFLPEFKSQESNECNEYSDYTETESADEEDVSYRTELKKLEDLGECRQKLLQSKLNDSLLVQNNYVDLRKESQETNHQELVHFDVLSRDDMTPVIIEEEEEEEEEEEDWVVV